MTVYVRGKAIRNVHPLPAGPAAIPGVLATARWVAEEKRMSENTEGACRRGCCWTPWAGSGVCAVQRACNCHHAPGKEDPLAALVRRDRVADSFTTSTTDFQEAA